MFKKNSSFYLLFLGLFIACERKAQSKSIHFFALDTPCSIVLQDYVPEELLLRAQEEVLRIEAMMSSYIPESEISLLNHNGKNVLSQETFSLIEQTLDYADQSNGLFDPTIGPLSQLWDITASRASQYDEKIHEKVIQNSQNNETRSPPSKENISAVLPLVSYKNIELNTASYQVSFLKAGMKLDLGGIAKGFAADRVMDILKKAQAPPGIIDFGGNILLHDQKIDNSPWSVGLRGEGATYLLGMFIFEPRAVVTSGIYQRYYKYEGQRYHHILSTKTGYPVNNGLFSVTVITKSSTVADALATILFIYGAEKGLQNVAQRQKNGEEIEALFVTENKQVYGSSGFKRLNKSQYDELKTGILYSNELPSDKIWIFSLEESLNFINM